MVTTAAGASTSIVINNTRIMASSLVVAPFGVYTGIPTITSVKVETNKITVVITNAAVAILNAAVLINFVAQA